MEFLTIRPYSPSHINLHYRISSIRHLGVLASVKQFFSTSIIYMKNRYCRISQAPKKGGLHQLYTVDFAAFYCTLTVCSVQLNPFRKLFFLIYHQKNTKFCSRLPKYPTYSINVPNFSFFLSTSHFFLHTVLISLVLSPFFLSVSLSSFPFPHLLFHFPTS